MARKPKVAAKPAEQDNPPSAPAEVVSTAPAGAIEAVNRDAAQATAHGVEIEHSLGFSEPGVFVRVTARVSRWRAGRFWVPGDTDLIDMMQLSDAQGEALFADEGFDIEFPVAGAPASATDNSASEA